MITLKQIKAFEWAGNHHHDSGRFKLIQGFVEDTTNAISDRAAAIRISATEGMGLTGADAGEGLTDEQLIALYLDER